MATIAEQVAREKAAVTRGENEFYSALEEAALKDREFDGKVGHRFVINLLHRFTAPVAQFQKSARSKWTEAQRTGRRLGGWEEMLLLLKPSDVAYLTVRTLLSSGEGKQNKLLSRARRVGSVLNQNARFRQLEDRERERAASEGAAPAYNRLNVLKREVKKINPKHAKRWEKRLDDLVLHDWPRHQRTLLGIELIQCLVDSCPESFEIHTYTVKGKTQKIVRRTAALEKALDRAYSNFALEQPWLIPMIIPPRPWGTHRSGGYMEISLDLIPLSYKLRQVPEEDQVSDRVIEAVNRVQNVPWAINRTLYRVALEARERNLEAVLPVAAAPELPARLPDETYQAMTREEKVNLALHRKAIHDDRNQLEGHRQTMRRQLEVARDCLDKPAIYFPHHLDFRGRMYPTPQDLNPQSDDFGKSLLVFSERRQLGADGFEWLCYHVANCYGQDKGSRADQLEWVADNDALIQAIATHPFEYVDEWAKADKPWQFLAAAVEYTNAQAEGADPAEFWSNLPVYVDGSCNGLQHLAAMSRDPQAALAVNLTRCLDRQDIYQNVADRVAACVDEDAARFRGASPGSLAHLAPAERWWGRVTRKVVKRPVMTLPYGLTPIGMKDQLIDDGFCRGLPGDPNENASYLRDKIMEALGEELGSALAVMEWLQDNAAILADKGNELGVTWTSPSDFTVHMEYLKLVPKVYTILGEYRLVPEAKKIKVTFQNADLEAGILKSRQRLAIVPNIIHSFDAAHLTNTVNASDPDIHISGVHDSFGCHAGDMPRFVRTIRQQFVEIYRRDWFASLMKDFENSRRGADIPLLPPPPHGSFDIEETLDAEYFFA